MSEVLAIVQKYNGAKVVRDAYGGAATGAALKARGVRDEEVSMSPSHQGERLASLKLLVKAGRLVFWLITPTSCTRWGYFERSSIPADE